MVGRPRSAARRRNPRAKPDRQGARGEEPHRPRRRRRRAPDDVSASPSVPARSSASPASPATARASCSKRIAGISPMTVRRDPAQWQATALRCDCNARAMRDERSPMCPKTAIAWASCFPSRPARTPFSAIIATRPIRSGVFLRPCAPSLADTRAQDGALRRAAAGSAICAFGLFSGGNQQKIVLAREIERDPDLLIVGQPTRGVDIGAIEFIHQRLVEHARSRQGGAPGLGRARRDQGACRSRAGHVRRDASPASAPPIRLRMRDRR